MSYGLAICSTCLREVHQDGPKDEHDRSTWTHCEDKSPRCAGAVSRYPDPANGVDVVGRACRADEVRFNEH
jgi:hypothetical protein